MFGYRQEPTWQREVSKTQHVAISDPLAIIYNEGLWRLNKVSPLYNLLYNTLKLKQYSSKIRQALVSNVTSSTLKYSVTLEEQPNLKYCEEDANALLLTVTSSQENNTKSKVAYMAIFLSWGLSTGIDNATHLPYMLEKGEQKVGSTVKSVLQTLFDCNIQQFSFTQHQLLEFGFSFVENDSPRSTDSFTLSYKTPLVEHKDKLNLTFDVGDVQIIWHGIKDETTTQLDLINLAYQMLQNQIFHMIALDITVFDLCEVSLQKAEVKSSGIVKMKTPEIVNCVFTVLNEITQDKTLTDSDTSDRSS